MMRTMGMDDERIGTVRQKRIWLQPNKHSTGAKPSCKERTTLFCYTCTVLFRLLSELPILIAARHVAAGALRVLSLESGQSAERLILTGLRLGNFLVFHFGFVPFVDAPLVFLRIESAIAHRKESTLTKGSIAAASSYPAFGKL